MSINIKKIAEKADVSTATVSRVLRNYPGVREKTRKKVLKVIKKYNYEINYVARNLRKKETKTIGLIVGNILSEFYSTLAKSIEDISNSHGYNLILCNSAYNTEKELEHLKTLRANRVAGIILCPWGKNKEYLNNIIDAGTKVVLLDGIVNGVKCDTVMSDNFEGTYKATKFLIKKGYRKISIISGNLFKKTLRDRVKGYIKALNEFDIKVNKNFVKICRGSGVKSGKEGCLELLKQKDKPDVIFPLNLDLTLGTTMAIKKEGLSIPDDIGLMGFDEANFSQIVTPPLTTIKQSLYELGKTATNLLIDRIENKKNLSYKNIRFKTEIIERDSV